VLALTAAHRVPEHGGPRGDGSTPASPRDGQRGDAEALASAPRTGGRAAGGPGEGPPRGQGGADPARPGPQEHQAGQGRPGAPAGPGGPGKAGGGPAPGGPGGPGGPGVQGAPRKAPGEGGGSASAQGVQPPRAPSPSGTTGGALALRPQAPGDGLPARYASTGPGAGPHARGGGRGMLAALAGFALLVVVPALFAAGYLFGFAKDQYASTTGFTVRREEAPAAAAVDLLGGLSQFGGGGPADADILHEFLRSSALVAAIEPRLRLRELYATAWPGDPVFGLASSASAERLARHWQRMTRVSYDPATGLIEFRARAFSPGAAQAIAIAVSAESERMINALSDAARADAMGHAASDLAAAEERLRSAREALTAFRTRTRIVDPEADLRGRMGVLGTLQQQLAEALIDHDMLLEATAETDPRVRQAERRIAVIDARIAEERRSVAEEGTGPGGEDYPRLMAEFERLSVDRAFAEESYRAALAAYDLARSNAARQSRYLATFVHPTLAETPEFPRRWLLLGIVTAALLLGWAVLALTASALRDRR